jgi:hypothetical protein
MNRVSLPIIILALIFSWWTSADAQSLRGSRASLVRQNRQAKVHDYTYLKRPADVQRFVEAGYLVRIRGNADYELARVSFPYARPEVRVFLERLGQQYRAACGEKLVVTSLVRPITRQPHNASPLSVHPTGMAIDLRRSSKAACRNWLERVLLQLEGQGTLEATRETRPPHYHVALFPKPYLRYVARLEATPVRLASSGDTNADGDATTAYRVRRGDSLWTIARRHGTTVDALKEANGLRSARLLAGQRLQIPTGN